MTSENITYILGGDEFMDSDASCQYQVVMFFMDNKLSLIVF